jgi:hypothetical protein
MSALHVRCNALQIPGVERCPQGPSDVGGEQAAMGPKAQQPNGIPALQAEGEGFEPSVDRKADNGFRDRAERPQCRITTGVCVPGECRGE